MERVIIGELNSISRAAMELVRNGWARSSSGNISLRSRAVLNNSPKDTLSLDPRILPEGILQDMLFWMTKTGSTMEEVSKDPEGNAGLYRVCERSLELLAGTGPPSTEVAVHMLILSGTKVDAIVHCHWDDIGEISQNAIKGSIPGWIGVSPVHPPGSLELAEGTSKEAAVHRLIIWPQHGVIAFGRDLEECLSTIKGARTFLGCTS